MSAKDLFDSLKKEKDDAAAKAAIEADRAEADAKKRLGKVFKIVEKALDGLFWERVSQGHYLVYHDNRPVYIEVRWHLEKYQPYDECQETEEWVIKIGVSNQAFNVPDFYCDAGSFEESLAKHLLYRR